MDYRFPSFELAGQVALVTGAARGIGRACALALADAGANIVLGLRDIKSGQALLDEIQAMDRQALAVQMNLRDLGEIESAVQQAVSTFGRIDILINNAGLGALNPAEKVTETDFDETININLKGTFFTAQAVGKVMIQQRYGRIINIGSQAGIVALPDESVYCMTKAAISHLTRCLAVEWAEYNILVNCVAPTFIETPGTHEMLADEAYHEWVLSKIALHRVGDVMEVAGPVLFLASAAASLITGETLVVDGGWTIH